MLEQNDNLFCGVMSRIFLKTVAKNVIIEITVHFDGGFS